MVIRLTDASKDYVQSRVAVGLLPGDWLRTSVWSSLFWVSSQSVCFAGFKKSASCQSDSVHLSVDNWSHLGGAESCKVLLSGSTTRLAQSTLVFTCLCVGVWGTALPL